MRSARFFALSLVALAAGCQAPRLAAVDHMATYVRTRLDMVPVTPMREDIRVGDVFIYPTNPEGTVGDEVRTETVLSGQRWTSMSFSDDLVSEFRERPELPATPDEYGENPAWPATELEGVLFARDGASNHLRSVHLPGFSVSRDQLDGALPNYVNSLASGGSVANWTSIGMRIPAAEAYSLDVEDVMDGILVPGRRGTQTQRVKPELLENLVAFTDRSRRTIYMRVVTEVLFARAVQLTITYDYYDWLEGEDDVEASELGLTDMEDADDDEDDDELDPTLAPVARARAMNDSMKKSGTDALPDGFVRFVTIGPHATTVRKVWRRPLALGVRGLTLEVDKATGDIIRIGWMGKPLRAR